MKPWIGLPTLVTIPLLLVLANLYTLGTVPYLSYLLASQQKSCQDKEGYLLSSKKKKAGVKSLNAMLECTLTLYTTRCCAYTTATVATVVSVMQKKKWYMYVGTVHLYICTFTYRSFSFFFFLLPFSYFLAKAGKNRRTLAPSRSPGTVSIA